MPLISKFKASQAGRTQYYRIPPSTRTIEIHPPSVQPHSVRPHKKFQSLHVSPKHTKNAYGSQAKVQQVFVKTEHTSPLDRPSSQAEPEMPKAFSFDEKSRSRGKIRREVNLTDFKEILGK